MKHGFILTNWDLLSDEIKKHEDCIINVEDIIVKLLETSHRAETLSELNELHEDGLHQETTLTDPVVPWDLEQQWDELTGKVLDLEKVVQGRLKELQKFSERRVYRHVSREEMLQDIEGKLVKTRWVQTMKGEEVRCRLVAQEYAKGDPREDLFAGTPPLFAARLLVSRTASSRKKTLTLMVLDISCAFLYADIKRRIYIELPEEDPESKTGNMVGRLEKALYGTRDAPQAWHEELSKTLQELGFKMSMQ